MLLALFLICLMKFNFATDNVFSDRSTVKSASAICTEDGIAANIKFNRFFGDKIYSFEYHINPDCIYHNKNDTPILEIEFVIPPNKCGTRIFRNTRNIVDLLAPQLISDLSLTSGWQNFNGGIFGSGAYSLLVHSCYASDKEGLEKIILIDQYGKDVE
ncbi:hypothetical protein ACH3XW_4825 [Acanthocheilonema viteae]